MNKITVELTEDQARVIIQLLVDESKAIYLDSQDKNKDARISFINRIIATINEA